MNSTTNKTLSSTEAIELLGILKTRFEENMNRHEGLLWEDVQVKLQASPEKLWSLKQMEETGGQPDVVDFDEKTGEYTFFDCSKQTPIGRRSICYDQAAWESRKTFKPANSAMNMAAEMGIELLNQEQYEKLQSFGEFDTKTSSWIVAPDKIRKLGGGLFAHFRYGQIFVYHNGVESYYAERGFRGFLKV